jgi:hypothetical protein
MVKRSRKLPYQILTIIRFDEEIVEEDEKKNDVESGNKSEKKNEVEAENENEHNDEEPKG